MTRKDKIKHILLFIFLFKSILYLLLILTQDKYRLYLYNFTGFFSSNLFAQDLNYFEKNTTNDFQIIVNSPNKLIFTNKINTIKIKNIDFKKNFLVSVEAINFNNKKYILFKNLFKRYKSEYTVTFFVPENITKIIIFFKIDDYINIKKTFNSVSSIIFQKYYLYNVKNDNIFNKIMTSYRLIRSYNLENLHIFDVLIIDISENFYLENNTNIKIKYNEILTQIFKLKKYKLNILILYKNKSEFINFINLLNKNYKKYFIKINKGDNITNIIISNNKFIFIKKNTDFVINLKKVLEKLKIEKINFFDKIIDFDFNSKTFSYIEFKENKLILLNIQSIHQTINTVNKHFFKPEIVDLEFWKYVVVLIIFSIFALLYYKFSFNNKIIYIVIIFIILCLYNFYIYFQTNNIYQLELKLPLSFLTKKKIYVNVKNQKTYKDNVIIYQTDLFSTTNFNVENINNMINNDYNFVYLNILSQNDLYPIEKFKKFIFIKFNNIPIAIYKNNKIYLKFNKKLSIEGIK